MLAIKTILHPTDFSSQAIAGFHLACSLARDYKAKLLLLHVQPPPETVVGEFGAAPPPPQDADGQALRDQLFAMKPTDPDVQVDYFFVEGDPVREIIRLAKEQSCDLIVMGTHGRSGLSRLIMGSVAEQIMRNSPCPVLTLKSEFEAKQ